jgi:uncharacterized membrane protein YfcA
MFLTGTIYFFIILGACSLGAIVGLGGGVFIRPIFDALGRHDVLNIAFFSSSAIFIMAIVSTIKKVQDGTKIEAKTALLVSAGAVAGGMVGNLLLEYLLRTLDAERYVQMAQIVVTVIVLAASLFFTAKSDKLHFPIKNSALRICMGVALGAIAVFLGIGGGPINVPVFMIFFGLNIKDATAYSIVVIFFSHLSRLITMGITEGYSSFDLPILGFVVVAAAAGGLLGARLSKTFSEQTVKRLFQAAISAVILLNIFNGLFVI